MATFDRIAAEKRRKHIVKLYLQKKPFLTVREIGLAVDPQISAQRVTRIIRQEGAPTRR